MEMGTKRPESHGIQPAALQVMSVPQDWFPKNGSPENKGIE